MSALTERIAEVLQEQQCIRCGCFHAYGRVQNCGGRTTYAGLAYVAERIEAAISSACTCNLPDGVHQDFHTPACPAWSEVEQ